MRSGGGAGKKKDSVLRQTRSGLKGQVEPARAVRPTRAAAAKPKSQARPVAQTKNRKPPQQTQQATAASSAAAAKKQPQPPTTSSRQSKTAQPKKAGGTNTGNAAASSKATKEQQKDNEREKIKEEDIKTEPVEVVIQVKKQRKTAKAETSKQGVASGKVGKRKGKPQCVKKEVLKKVNSKSEDKLDCMDTIVEVALVKKVLPKSKAEEKPKPKEKTIKKEKVEKVEKNKKNEKEEKKEVKKEPKPKEVKKDMKLDKKIKEEKMDETVIKEEKDVKENKVVKSDKKNADEKKKPVKPKNKAKKVEEPVVNVSDSEKSNTPKPKVKLEKISPITVKDEEPEDKPSFSERDLPSPVPEPPAKKQPVKATKKKQPPKAKCTKVVPPKKKVQLRPVKRPPKKEEEPPPIIQKRHREASLNALAKVHCLYENESRGAMNEILDKSILKRKTDIKVEKVDVDSESQNEEVEEEKPSRTLRTAPGMRGVGRHWDANIPSSSSSSFSSSSSSSEDEESEKQKEEDVQKAVEAGDEMEEEEEEEEEEVAPPKEPQKPEEKKVRKRRKRCEVRMDLKDMVVTKRMASLNASAMMAATYSLEKRGRGDDKKRSGGRSSDDTSSSSAASDDSSDDDVILSGSSKKVAVIVNQDTDLTITGLYTTRSTHREGFCSIAGMQYRISSTSHTQTEATAVSTETVIHTTDHVSVSHSESGGSVDAGTSSPGGSCKSYTPLGALSSMQPPGQGRPCGPSAFSAPYHPHPQELHGYYQPAGPLISHGTAGGSSGSKSATPEPPYPPPPAHPPYTYATAYDYPGYYGRRYARPWPSTSQMMTEYLEPPAYAQTHPNYYHPYPVPPTVPPPPPPPPPVCYTSPVRGLPYMEQPYQCPCPMQSSCPKNVHTGPPTGASKRSEATEAQTNNNNNEVTPLLPVALALPPEPTGVSPGPPSPARGSAGMPPPASPALSTARNNRWSPPESGVIKVVTPPPPITIVETSPPPATSPPKVETPPPPQNTTTCKRRNKRVASDISHEVVVPVTKKRRKSTIISSKQNNKSRGIKKEKEERIELKNNNNNNYKKSAEMQLRRNPSLKWSNGWSWEGEPFTAKVFLDTEDMGVLRKCYPAMRHRQGDLIQPRDCILLKSGPRKNLPFVAKISAMWENPEDGEMMVSVLWYYRPEHTEQGRTPDQPVDEIFASRHKDTNSVACIEDKCYVLTYHEYCRYRKSLLSNGRKCHTVVPAPSEGYPRSDQLPPGQVASDLVFFCRQVYDFRQKKILKKPPSQPQSRT